MQIQTTTYMHHHCVARPDFGQALTVRQIRSHLPLEHSGMSVQGVQVMWLQNKLNHLPSTTTVFAPLQTWQEALRPNISTLITSVHSTARSDSVLQPFHGHLRRKRLSPDDPSQQTVLVQSSSNSAVMDINI